MARILLLAIAVLTIPAAVPNADASSCGQISKLSEARLRWAATRQVRVDPAQTDKTCRAYGQQFYEAVEARARPPRSARTVSVANVMSTCSMLRSTRLIISSRRSAAAREV